MIRTLLCRKYGGTFIFIFSSFFLFSQFAAAQAPLPNVKLFTTGGTIQSKGDHRQKLMEYSSGKVAPEELINDLPELKKIANVTYLEESNIVTHGTGTLEETAYFLNLVIKSDKPVMVVGAMRPFSAVSRDGPFNLLNAVRVASSPSARGYGVMIMLNDEINAARDTTKNNTYRVDTFVARDMGPLGYTDSDRIVFYRKPTYRHTFKSEFDVADLKELPRVDVTYVYQESDATPIKAFVKAGAKGIVLTDSDDEAIKKGQKKGVVFVKSDRKGSGRVVESEKQAGLNIVTSDNLPPHKARILLRLALTKTKDPKEIQRMFNEY
jgi:L-asparaginase